MNEISESARVLGIKHRLFSALSALAECEPETTANLLEAHFEAGAVWRVAHPINELVGSERALRDIWLPLKTAIPDLERRDFIFVGGTFEGRDYVAAAGHYCGTFRRDFLSIPATNAPVFLRYGEVYQVQDGKIVQANLLWDILDLIRQAGFWPIAPSLGREGRWSGPITGDGIMLREVDAAQSAASLAQTLAMHKTLGDYDDREMRGRDGLLAMPQREYWHPKMMWYGPAGIGTTRGLSGFVDCHQLPFRLAFPNRKGGSQWDEITEEKRRRGGGHYIHIGDGPYSVTGGWPSVFARHSGGSFLGQAPTGKTVTMRVMDFYLHHEGLIRENWVPIDILDLLMQMGFDVLDRLKQQTGGRRLT